MKLFRREHGPKPKTSMSAYAQAESNPELIAAEAEVNTLPTEVDLVNPIEEERLDPY